ncbi:MAG: acetyl-CoA carboxylase carboxyltransferase subunit beta [Actinomycetia bacterium]|nr:acetyl-CoA carboxylase carboxyltransferase subunit beta [Actinomycetes bacterium]
MPFTDWLKNRTQKTQEAANKRAVPDGIWSRCTICGKTIFQKDILNNFHVCPECGHHFGLSGFERVMMLLDDGSFSATEEDLWPKDPLGFVGSKPYRQSLNNAIETTGRREAATTGFGRIKGNQVGFGVFDFKFIAGSMGSVVGEKIARLFETATSERLPVITVVSSGGARMQEGVLSLMQMAKTAATVEQHNQARLPYISILANPTTGGVLASFASLGDIIIAEPKALIGFAGPRVIEQTLDEKLPKGFQTSESVLNHGMVDMIVPRDELRETVGRLISGLSPASSDQNLGDQVV